MDIAPLLLRVDEALARLFAQGATGPVCAVDSRP
jgi:hypothetical protein